MMRSVLRSNRLRGWKLLLAGSLCGVQLYAQEAPAAFSQLSSGQLLQMDVSGEAGTSVREPNGVVRILSQGDALEAYIQMALDSNIVIQQKNISLEKALLALRTAKNLYAPSVAFMGAYQSGDGGRDIPLPLGDLLNDAYATLNQLTGSQRFPHLQNESINFFPRNFYDAKVRTTLPLFNKDISHNRQISEQQLHLKEYELEAYRRELVKEIKLAYFDHLRSLQAVTIQESALQLALEGKRTNEKLLEHGKGLPAYVLRAESEIAAIEAELARARQQVENAGLYFNMLVNRPAFEPIDTSFNETVALRECMALMNDPADPQQREELQSLRTAIELNETILKMNRQFAIPKLNGFLDIGSQAEGFKFNRQSRYYLAGLQLDIPLFSAQRNNIRIKENNLAVRDARLHLQQVTRQLLVSSQVARNNLSSTWKTYQSSLVRLRAAETYQRLIERGYQAGTNSYIETVDARNQLTAARLATILDQYSVLQAAAVLERETASYSFSGKN